MDWLGPTPAEANSFLIYFCQLKKKLTHTLSHKVKIFLTGLDTVNPAHERWGVDGNNRRFPGLFAQPNIFDSLTS